MVLKALKRPAFRVGPLFMVKQGDFEQYRFGKKDIELRAIRGPWKNARAGDVATLQCGRRIFRKRIVNVLHGSLARIFMDVHYRRVFPQALTVFEAVQLTGKRIPNERMFMAFELKDFA